MRIGLVSDTHVPTTLRRLPDTLLRALEGVDRILHAGDLVSRTVLEQLGTIAPTTAVAGNMDPPELARSLGAQATLTLAGHTIGVQHGHQRPALQNTYIGQAYDAPEFDIFFQAMNAQLPNAQIIVFGHFHVPVIRQWHDTLFINPGSVAPPHAHSTIGLLHLGESAEVEIIRL